MASIQSDYVHGYEEAGCGAGAQTVPLIRNSPDARLTCLHISAASLATTVIDSGLAAILNATTPVFSILIAHFFTRDETLSLGKVVAGIVRAPL